MTLRSTLTLLVALAVSAPAAAQEYVRGSTTAPNFTGQAQGPGSSCVVPAYAIAGSLGTGLGSDTGNAWCLNANGVAILRGSSTAVTSTVPIRLPDGTSSNVAIGSESESGWFFESTNNYIRGSLGSSAQVLFAPGATVLEGGSAFLRLRDDAGSLSFGASDDVSLSRGAANRLDLESGDSLYLVGGGLGVGVAPSSAGIISANVGIYVGAGGSIVFGAGTQTLITPPSNGKMLFSTNNGTDGILSDQFTNNPTCPTNCGTSPTLDGVDSAFTLTMGASGSPASGFVVTFNGTWAANPQCVSQMAKAGMVVGKIALTIVTTTTTATFVTNGTAPATTDMYHVLCRLGQ